MSIGGHISSIFPISTLAGKIMTVSLQDGLLIQSYNAGLCCFSAYIYGIGLGKESGSL
jgi:hypothetical protein